MKNLLKRWWLSFLIRSEEIHLEDLQRVSREIKDARTYINLTMAIYDARNELAKLRSEYNALLPVGQRKTWKVA